MKAIVTYAARGDATMKQAEVEVTQLVDGKYYATNLALWGCGKSSTTPQGAVRMLVQDMANIFGIKIQN